MEWYELREKIAEEKTLHADPVLTSHYDDAGRRTHVTVEWPSDAVKQCTVSREVIDDMIRMLDDRETQWIYYSDKEARFLEYAIGVDKFYLAVTREELDRYVARMKKDGVFDDFHFFKVIPDKTVGKESITPEEN